MWQVIRFDWQAVHQAAKNSEGDLMKGITHIKGMRRHGMFWENWDAWITRHLKGNNRDAASTLDIALLPLQAHCYHLGSDTTYSRSQHYIKEYKDYTLQELTLSLWIEMAVFPSNISKPIVASVLGYFLPRYCLSWSLGWLFWSSVKYKMKKGK